MEGYLLTILIFLPLGASLLVIAMPGRDHYLPRILNLGVGLVQLLLGIWMALSFRPAAGGYSFRFEQKLDWINLDLGGAGKLLVQYHVGVDGLSFGLLLLSIVVLLIGAISSWPVRQKPKGYYALYLLLNGSIIGCFAALDLFLFYLFFEFMLLPMYFLIGIWGGPRRTYASIKFFLYTLVGSLLILIVVIGLYLSYQVPGVDGVVHSFSMVDMTNPDNLIPGSVLSYGQEGRIWGMEFRTLAFVLLIIGFAIKVPSVPLHTWLPDAHVEAPTAISVILAGVLLKVGGYGIIRIAYPIFPEAAADMAWLVGGLGAISIVYGALNALAQKDLKRLIAYSSVSHMGFVMLGVAALTVESVSGAVYQMVSHGFITSMLFLIAGVIYDRTGDREIVNFSGLARKMPHYAVVVGVAFFAGLGLPGFSGFIAELLVLLGAFRSEQLPLWMTIVALVGILLAAVYFLWTLQRMFFGGYFVRYEKYDATLNDLDFREKLMFIPLILLVLLLGVFPDLLLSRMNTTMELLISFCQSCFTP